MTENIKYLQNHHFNAASVIITEECNLECSYCYQTKEREKKNMDKDTAEKVVDFLINGAKNMANHGELDITFFGGEPTLNIPIMRHIFDYGFIRCSKENIEFRPTITTNGTVWNDELEKFYEHWVKAGIPIRVQLSIDGTPDVLNFNRKCRLSTKSTSEMIEKTVSKYHGFWDKHNLPKNKLLSHGCITKFSLPYFKESYEYIKDVLGIDTQWYLIIHEEDWDDNDPDIYEDHLRYIMEKIYQECIETNSAEPYSRFSNLNYFTNDRPSRCCGAGDTFCTIDPDGVIYPCHKFKYPTSNQMILGHIDKGVYLDVASQFMTINRNNVFGLNNCGECENVDCRICMAQNYDYNKDLCKSFPKMCKLALRERKLKLELRNRLESARIIRPIQNRNNHGYSIENMFKDLAYSIESDLNDYKSDLEKDISMYLSRGVDLNGLLKSVVDLSSIMVSFNDRLTNIENVLGGGRGIIG